MSTPNIGYSTLALVPSSRGFAPALSGSVTQAGRHGRAGGAVLTGRVLPALARLAGPIGIAFAAKAAFDFGKAAVASASELQQNEGAVHAVLKGDSTRFLKWSRNAATDVGVAASEYDRLGTLLGSQLKNGGVPLDQLAGKTKSLISTGADLSAMFGGSAADAVDALSSALKGERDPIERYGVSLNQAKIDAEAAALGFEKTGNSLSSEANQAATLSLIMKQTSDAHGAFARENDTLAHKQQVLNALWTDGKARIGNALLPAVTGLTGVLISGLGPALSFTEKGITGAVKGVGNFVDGFRNGTDAVGSNQSRLAAVGASFFAAVQPIDRTIGGLFAANAAALAPFLPRITAAGAVLVPTLIQIATQLSPIAILFRALGGQLPALAAAFAQFEVRQLGSTIGLLASVFRIFGYAFASTLPTILANDTALIRLFVDAVSHLAPALLGAQAGTVPLVSTVVSMVAPALVQLVATLLPAIASLLDTAQAVGPLVTVLASVLVPVIQALLPVITAVFGAIVPIISAALQIVKGVIMVVTGIITGNWTQVWNGLKTILSGVWNAIKAVVTGAIGILKAVISAGLGVIRALWNAAWNALAGLVSAVFGKIGSAASSGISTIVGFFTGLGSKIEAGVGNLASIGRNMIEGLIGGVREVAGNIKDAVLGPIQDSVSAVKNFLGIHSPSRLFRSIGRFVTQGFTSGIQGGSSQVLAAMQSLSNKLIDATNAKAISNAQRDRGLILINSQDDRLAALASRRTSLAKKITAATKTYASALKTMNTYAAKVAKGITSDVDASKSYDLVGDLTLQLSKTKELQKTLASLKKLGIDKTTYAQLAEGGIDSLGSAEMLLATGKAGVKQAAALQKQLGTAANSLGKTTASGMYGAGVNAAKGLVNGLKGMTAEITAKMRGLADALVADLKSRLGIHSPSTVLFDHGAETVREALYIEPPVNPTSFVLTRELYATFESQRPEPIELVYDVPAGLSAEAAAELSVRQIERALAKRDREKQQRHLHAV